MNSSITSSQSIHAASFDEGTERHRRALFSPVQDVREDAWRELRAESSLAPSAWEKLDEATGVKQSERDEELTADANLAVDSWQAYSETVLDDQFVSSNIVDMMIGAGFGVDASLFQYAYFDRLTAVRLEGERSMNARATSTQDMPAQALHGVPLWIHHVDYEFDSREYQNAQLFGNDLDASVGTEARRALNRIEHDLVWNGEGREIPTDRGTLAVTGLDTDDTGNLILQAATSSGWDTNAENILADVKELHDTIETQTDVVDTNDVPTVSETGGRVFVPKHKWAKIAREDYETSATDEPLSERLDRKYPYLEFVPAPRLSDDSMILLLNDPRYFQVVNAQNVTNTSWEVEGGFGLRNKVLSSRTPFVRRSPDGIRGIARLTGIDA